MSKEYIVEPGQVDYGDAAYAVADTEGNIIALAVDEESAVEVAAALNDPHSLPLLEALERYTSALDAYRNPRLSPFESADAQAAVDHAEDGLRAAIRAARGEA